MNEMQRRCFRCMKEIGSAELCPHCGFDMNQKQAPLYLPMGIMVGSRYLVGLVKDRNTEGVSYNAWDQNSGTRVYLREFLPDAIIARGEDGMSVMVMRGSEQTYSECQSAFVELWRQLARLRQLPALPNVLDIFEENGTTYVVTEYEKSFTLREVLLKSSTGSLSWSRARQLFMPVISTLSQLHSAGIIHRGISPTTLILCEDGKVKLSGFSIAQVRSAGSELSPELFNGYAAIEQYDPQGSHSSRTDIYAFAAVIYRTLVGSDPIDSPSRMRNDQLMIPGKIAEQIPAYVINALINALQIEAKDRTDSFERFRNELSASPSAAIAATNTSVHEPDRKAEISPKISLWSNMQKGEKRKFFAVALATILVGLIIIAIFALVKGNSDKKEKDTTSKVSSTAEVEMVFVPDFVQRRRLDVETDEKFMQNFNLIFIEEFHESQEFGTIIGQSIPPQTNVQKGTTITLTVSQGIEMIKLPTGLIGMNYEEARDLLSSLGFSVEKKEDANDGTKTEGQVKEINLAAGKDYASGTAVTLKVWGPVAETTTAVTTTRPQQTTRPTTTPPSTTTPTTSETTTEAPTETTIPETITQAETEPTEP